MNELSIDPQQHIPASDVSIVIHDAVPLPNTKSGMTQHLYMVYGLRLVTFDVLCPLSMVLLMD